ncbi:hypothetical protein B0T24DRAFT_642925 [Lasiosphaeria ovina]|uniref:Uncharacterized protein n=1 Tax=Lasiosphaeria ovina TaxID=92902 RepID=A0AAE0MYS4_9PEZI|nr:hypothetical protein B0T24DRAFT_642925 [Lasiosphaeria ovina]
MRYDMISPSQDSFLKANQIFKRPSQCIFPFRSTTSPIPKSPTTSLRPVTKHTRARRATDRPSSARAVDVRTVIARQEPGPAALELALRRARSIICPGRSQRTQPTATTASSPVRRRAGAVARCCPADHVQAHRVQQRQAGRDGCAVAVGCCWPDSAAAKRRAHDELQICPCSAGVEGDARDAAAGAVGGRRAEVLVAAHVAQRDGEREVCCGGRGWRDGLHGEVEVLARRVGAVRVGVGQALAECCRDGSAVENR